MMKKEKLEQMKELGRGGLSKGLTMLRNAAEKAAAAADAANEKNAQNAAAYAAIGNGTLDDAAGSDGAAAVGSTAGNAGAGAGAGGAGNRLTYDELVTLSMKLTRQNKMMKAQFQKIQTRLTALSMKEADANVLSDFVANVVGVDLDACHVDESKSSTGDSAAASAGADSEPTSAAVVVRATIDAKQLKERYAIQRELLEREHQSQVDQLRAELAALRRSSESNGTSGAIGTAATANSNNESVSLLSFSPVGAPPAPELRNYDEIDLLGEPFVAPSTVDAPSTAASFDVFGGVEATSGSNVDAVVTRLRTEVADAAAELERLRDEVSQRTRAHAELETTSRDALQQRDAQVCSLENERDELTRALEARASDATQWQTRYDEQTQTLAVLRADLAASNAVAVGASEDDVARLSAEVVRLNDTIVALEEAAAATRAALDQAKGESATLTHARDELNAALQANNDEIAQLRTELAALQEHANEPPSTDVSADDAPPATGADLHAQVTELETALASAHTELESVRDAAVSDRKALDAEVERLEEAAAALTRENESLRAQLSDSNSVVSTEQSDVTALLNELEKVKMAHAEADHALRTTQDKLRASETQYKAAQDEIERSSSLVDALKTDTNRLVDELTASERERADLERSLETLTIAKESLEEELSVLRRDSHANLESTLNEVEATKQRVAAAELATAQAESRMNEERAYLKSKIESLIKDLDNRAKRIDELDAAVAEKDKQVAKMAASQAAITADMMELQTQLSAMRQDLGMAAEGLEAHAMRAEQSDRKHQEVVVQLTTATQQLESVREQLSDAQAECAARQTRLEALELVHRDAQTRVSELETIVSTQTTAIGNLSVDLAETKKALSDRMGLATRLQTENMSIAAKHAEQAAQIENALRDATASRARADAIETQMADARAEMQRAVQAKSDTVAAMKRLQLEVEAQQAAAAAEMERTAAACQASVEAERESCRRDIERIEAESKHKSKLALTAVLEKEAEIARLARRLAELEEDVRSGDADHRKIFEVAQLQAKREAESRAMAAQLQDMATQLREAHLAITQLQSDKLAHESELAALMQTQRREGVNLEYLKNVVVQYMSFRPGSSQQSRLVPVLSTLLQFSTRDLAEIKNASSARRSSWTSWGSDGKDYKPILDAKGQRHSMIPPSPVTSSAGGSGGGAVPSAGLLPRAASFTLPRAIESAASDSSAFASHASSESHDF